MQQSSSISISTNLVTLSVHDSLTFDGVEIAINPDVFITKSSVPPQHSRNPSYVSNATQFISIPPPSPILPAPHMIASPIMLGTPVNVQRPNDDSSRSIDSPKLNTTIQPGDIVEIKIWDKKTRHTNQSSSSSSSLSPDGKGRKQMSVGVSGASKQNESILIKAASKLQQQISPPSIFHPLSEQNRERTKSSSRPPIVPRSSSNGSGTQGLSSLATSPKHASNSPTITPPKPVNLFSRRSDVPDVGDGESVAQTSDIPVIPQLLRPRNFPDGSSPEKGTQNRWGLNLTPTASNAALGSLAKPSEEEAEDKHGKTGRGDQALTVIEPLSKDQADLGDGASSIMDGKHSRISSLGSSVSHVDEGEQAKLVDPFEAISKTHNLRLKFVTAVTDKSLRTLKAGGRTQISILRQIADLYELSSYDMVTITKFDKDEEESVQNSSCADYVTMTIKDQFISRGEMVCSKFFFL
jgi:hypothetical protein